MDDLSATPRITARARLVVPVLVFVAVTGWWWVLIDGVGALMGAEYTRGAHIVRAVGATLFVVALITSALRYPVRGHWSGLGLGPLRTGWRQFVFGAACWGIPAAVMFAISLGAGWAELTLRASATEIAGAVLGLTVLVLLYEAIPEELVFRGYFFTVLTGRFAPAWAVLGQALLFTVWGALNGAQVSVERTVLFVVFASVLGALRAVTGTVYSCMGFHTAFQVTAQLFGDHWPQVLLTDPDMNVTAVAFVLVPFAATALLMWWRSGPRATVHGSGFSGRPTGAETDSA